jgi:hypothetical protein
LQFCPCNPASDTLSPLRLPCMERLDPARSEVAHRIPTAAGPRAARRLLPPIQSTSTAAHRPNSAEHHRRRPRRRSSFSCDALSDVIAKLRMATLLSERSQPRCHGSGDSDASDARDVHFRHRDRSRYRLCPNPIGSDTSCRIARRARTGDILARGGPRPRWPGAPYAFCRARRFGRRAF